MSTRHERQGWVQICCPFCQDDDYHLGFKVSGGYFNCFHCGGMGVIRVLRKLFPAENLRRLISSYERFVPVFNSVVEKPKPVRIDVKLPSHTPLGKRHKQYLLGRKFDPDELEQIWGLQATTHIGRYAFRILIPIKHRNRIVSFQTRDITDCADTPYIASNPEDEVRSIHDCLYGYDEAKEQGWPFVVVFEGVPAVWRFGIGSVATFGCQYTPAQVRLLAQWETILVWFDNDAAGHRAGEKLAGELSVLGRKTIVCFNEKGHGKAPDEWSQSLANITRRRLYKKFGK